MDEITLQKYIRLAAIGGALVLLFVIGLLIYLSVTFRLTGTSPSTHGVATVSPFFKVNFNKPLNSAGLSVTGGPNLVDSYSVKGSVITILLKEPLSAKQTYTIHVRGILSVGGKRLADKTFIFTPKDIPDNELSPEQQQALQTIQQQYNKLIQNDPLVQLLPFVAGGNEFRIDYNVQYVHQKPVPIIVITSPTAQGQSDALKWIQEVGVDPAKYTIKSVSGSI